MPIKGVLLIIIVAMICSVIWREEIWSYLNETFGTDNTNNEEENEEV